MPASALRGRRPRRATEWAAEQNEFGWNAHYVVNPVDPSHVGAARADAIVGSRYVFIDADTPEALARIEASALAPSIEVTTGTVPTGGCTSTSRSPRA